MSLVPWDYQDQHSDDIAEILKTNLIAYIAWEERTGKSLTAILVCEKIKRYSILIVTKKGRPLQGWLDTLASFEPTKRYDVINYHQVHKKNPEHYDLVILDESHNYISGYPKRSAMWLKMRKMTKNKPILYISATPHAQGYQLLYNQFALSDWSPWNGYSSFYEWFRSYGVKHEIKINSKWIEQYDRMDENKIIATSSHLFSTKTRRELGFKYEPTDKLHYIELSSEAKAMYNQLLKTKVLDLGKSMLLADTVMKLRSALHMIEGGGLKTQAYSKKCQATYNDYIDADVVQVDKEVIEGAHICHLHYSVRNSTDKIDYILATWGDTKDLAIMYNYKFERYKLEQYFENAEILQATTNAEGIELSGTRHLVIYSQDFSTARHTQRRARQASKLRKEKIKVHYLLVRGAISEQAYKTTAVNKKNYVDSLFERKEL